MKRQRVRRLALSYLAVIMTLSLVFSVIIYAITYVQLNRPLPPGEHAQQPPELIERQFSRRLEQRNRETRGSVIMSLVVLNGRDVTGWLLAESAIGTSDARAN